MIHPVSYAGAEEFRKPRHAMNEEKRSPPKLLYNWQRMFRPFKFFSVFVAVIAALFSASHAQDNFQRFSVLPFGAYTEETKIQYGAVFVLFFRPFQDGEYISSMDFIARGTTRGQFQFQYAPNMWLLGDHLHIPAKFNANKWQYSLFERGARGDFEPVDEYKSTFVYGKVPFELNFGIPSSIPFRYGVVLEGEARDNELGSDIPKNYQDGYYLGGGYLFVIEKNDNKNWPTKGYYASFEEIFFGGDFSYHTEALDIRLYAPLFWNTSVAAGMHFKQSRGDCVPLGKLAGPDGAKRFRGVESGIWSDTQAIIWQLELRRPLFWRFAGVIFGEALQSAPYFSELFNRQMHYSVGFGGRLALNRSEKLHARADLSLVDGKHIGITIDLREAF